MNSMMPGSVQFISRVSPHVHALQATGSQDGRLHATAGSLNSTGLTSVRDIREQFQMAKTQSISGLQLTDNGGGAVSTVGRRSISARIVGGGRTGTGLSLGSTNSGAANNVRLFGNVTAQDASGFHSTGGAFAGSDARWVVRDVCFAAMEWPIAHRTNSAAAVCAATLLLFSRLTPINPSTPNAATSKPLAIPHRRGAV